MTNDTEVWGGLRVLVTGHTGFKGGWLALWLNRLGSVVTGYSLEPPTQPSLFEAAQVNRYVDSVSGDVRNLNALIEATRRAQPEVIFHMAAQPLVRASYADPIGTYLTNVIGTANVLEAARSTDSVRAVVVVTTDKCYENRETVWPYREPDPLGGHDPYSSSKACAEIVTAAYRRSFFQDSTARITTVRAGNVIGGGDWAVDRLIPDCVRALSIGKPVEVRNPSAVRPWQHVLEPLAGYIALAERMLSGHGPVSGAYNFGPYDSDAWTVASIVDRIVSLWGSGSWIDGSTGGQLHEANILKLDSTLARTELGWRPRFSLPQALEATVQWYRRYEAGHAMDEFCFRQIDAYASVNEQREVLTGRKQ